MSTEIETVRVKCEIVEGNDLGFYVVNKEDLTAEHVLFDEPAKPAAPAAEQSWKK